MLLHPTAPPAPVPPAPPLPNGTFWTLPPLNANFVWLLGISHAGYLGYKAASKPAARAQHRTPPPSRRNRRRSRAAGRAVQPCASRGRDCGACRR